MKAKIVAIDDAMGQVLWTLKFRVAQGMFISEATTIYQDSKIIILLAENGKGSISRHTQHLDVR